MQNYKIILVDDEKIVLNDLKNMIDWDRAGFSIVGTAHNGKSALKLYQALKPDVIITDIKMPQMNGLDFIHEIRKINPDIYILILSSYGEFEYAKQAIQEGVVDYLLKLEITSSFFELKLKEIYSKLSSTKKQNKKAIRLELQECFSKANANDFNLIFQHAPESRKYIFITLTTNIIFQSDFLGFTRENNVEEEIITTLESILVKLNVSEDSILFLQNSALILGIHSKHFLSPFSLSIPIFINKIRHFSSCRTHEFRIIYWENAVTLYSFYHKYNMILPLINWYFLLNKQSVICATTLESQHYSKAIDFKDFNQLTLINPKEEQLAYLKTYSYDLFQNCDFLSLKNSFLYVCNTLQKKLDATFLSEVIESPSLYEQFLTAGFKDWNDSLMSEPIPTYSTVINHAITYICHQYMNCELNLDEISHHVGLSSGRLSVLFKKETKITPNEWITNHRVKEAIKLLLYSNYKIYEISEKVGYRSSQYFSQIFLQHTGKKPLDYRKNTTITYTAGEMKNEKKF